MRSFDFCHFEITLSADLDPGDLECAASVDQLRKCAARLADKAVRQYQIAKTQAASRLEAQCEREQLQRYVDEILKKSEGDRTPNEMANVKLLADAKYWERRERDFDYEDDFEEGL